MAKTNPLGNRTSELEINDAYSFPTADGSNGDILVTDGSGTVTWQVGEGGLIYEEVTDSSKQMEINYCYGAKNASGVAFILPATSSVGDIIEIVGISGVWEIHQWTDQQILYGTDSTSSGGEGILTSLDIGDCISLECIVANKTWRATCGWGNYNDYDNVLRVYTGNTNSFMIRANGTSWAWGYGFLLGDNTVNNKYSPVPIAGSPMFCSFYDEHSQFFCMSRKVDESIWTWGYNTDGILGDNSTTNRNSPVQVAGSHKFVSGARAYYFSGALKTDGSAWCWGTGSSGQLGNNSTSHRSSPVAVTGSHSFTEIRVAGSSSMARKSDGIIWMWGYNGYGNLGDNSKTNRSSPVAVVGSHSFATMKITGSTSYGLKADGICWFWGRNNYGQGGDYTSTDKSSPVAIVGSHSFTDIYARIDSHFVGLKANGRVWACGLNTYGQLGDQSATNRSSPVAVAGSHSFVSIVAMHLNFVLGLKADGSVWSWGRNNYGQLGDYSATDRSSPVAVVGSHSFTYITAVNEHVLALKANGEIWAWGRNHLGQLGDNSSSDRSSPVLVVGSPW